MKAFEPKWANPNDIKYGVNTLRLGGLHIDFIYDYIIFTIKQNQRGVYKWMDYKYNIIYCEETINAKSIIKLIKQKPANNTPYKLKTFVEMFCMGTRIGR